MRVLPHKSDRATQVSSPLDRCREDGVLGEGTEMGTDVTVAGFHPPDPALFAGMPAPVALRWARYFPTMPRDRAKAASLRNHVLALYDPLARRSQFPAGIRFCINVYTGCEHACRYPDLIVVLTDGHAPRPTVRHPDRWFWLLTERGTSEKVEGIGCWCCINEIASDTPDDTAIPF